MRTSGPADGLRRDRQYLSSGWRLEAVGAGASILARYGEVERVVDVVVRATGPEGLYYRSLYAATYLVRIDAAGAKPLELFVKIYDPPRGIAALKRIVRGGRAANVLRMIAMLQRRGFGTPQAVLKGSHAASGRTMLVTLRAEGVPLPQVLQCKEDATVRRHELIRALGAEVARLHQCGFVHGDLTPDNIFVAQQKPPRFIFLDHDRTRIAFPAGRRYRQLRNLVQLGRFGLPGISNLDRLGFFNAYAHGLGRVRKRAMLRRIAAMLARRRRKDAR
jgi:hypothetical protein